MANEINTNTAEVRQAVDAALKEQKKKKKTKKAIIFAVIAVFLLIVVSISLSGDNDDSDTQSATANNSIKYGELLSVIENNDIVVVKTKITSSYSHRATIIQNYFNVEDLIENQGFEKYSELQYWAVADMSNGSESKVVSFTLDSETIQMIYNGKIAGSQIGDYADDLWVHTSLRDGLSDNS